GRTARRCAGRGLRSILVQPTTASPRPIAEPVTMPLESFAWPAAIAVNILASTMTRSTRLASWASSWTSGLREACRKSILAPRPLTAFDRRCGCDLARSIAIPHGCAGVNEPTRWRYGVTIIPYESLLKHHSQNQRRGISCADQDQDGFK